MSDLEIKVKNLINEATSQEDEGGNQDRERDPEHEVLVRMKDHKEFLEKVNQNLPEAILLNEEEYEKQEKGVQEALEKFLEKAKKISNEILPYK